MQEEEDKKSQEEEANICDTKGESEVLWGGVEAGEAVCALGVEVEVLYQRPHDVAGDGATDVSWATVTATISRVTHQKT